MSKKRKITEGRWSADEVRLLKELLPNKRASEVAEKLRRSVGAVRRKEYSIGIRFPGRLWSEREIKLVKDLFPGKGPHQIARKIGRSADTICQKAYSMGLKRIGRGPHRTWSAGDVRLLKELLPNKTLSETAQRLGRSKAMVNQKAYSLGLKKIGPRSYRHWSADEVALLKELLPNKKLSEAAQRLGRSVETVRAKARKLGLRDRCRQPGRPWSNREIKQVKKLYPGKGPHQIARKIGRSVQAVKERAYQMGLTRDGFRHWSPDELRLLKKAYPIHSDSKKLAKRFGRPLSAVRQRAYDMGLTKEKRYYLWSAEEIKLLRKLYPHENTEDIADKLSRSLVAVVGKARKLRLKKANPNTARPGFWSKKEVRLLRKLYPGTTSRQIAAQLGRTLKSVMGKASTLGLTKR